MSNKTSFRRSDGISFFGLLTICFIVMKLTGYITWSWWAVTAPLWGPVLTGLVLFIIVGGVILALDK